jgi:hypothetical protein
MPCEVVKLGDGTAAIVCTRGERSKTPCRWCSRVHTKLCDYPLGGIKKGKSCDAPICDQHAREIGPDRHLCPPHREMWERDGCKLKL